MPNRPYDLKKRIHAGDNLTGISISMTVSKDELAKLVETKSCDFVWVDSQHSPYNEDRLANFCSAAQSLGIPVHFRIKQTQQTNLVGNYLDMGPTGVEIPQVELESTVDDAVRNFYYPQTGIRSWGGSNRVGISEHPDRLEYAQWWKETGVLWLQLESLDAVTNARKLAKLGVDCLSFGPNDLKYNLESNPAHPLKTVDDCVQHVVDQLSSTTVAVCFRPFSESSEDIKKYRDMGVSVILN